jgi:hypothetical protein
MLHPWHRQLLLLMLPLLLLLLLSTAIWLPSRDCHPGRLR